IREIEHLVAKTAASVVVRQDGSRLELAGAFPGVRDLSLPIDLGTVVSSSVDSALALGPDELFLINSTSGTTGLPKCVMHTENRWVYFHRLGGPARPAHPGRVL